MSLARTTTTLHGRPVTVECDVRAGLPAFAIVGLTDRAVRQTRERVRAAILTSGFEFPCARITVNLAPAHLRHRGDGFDLAIAVCVLAASGQLPAATLADRLVLGPLAALGRVAGEAIAGGA